MNYPFLNTTQNSNPFTGNVTAQMSQAIPLDANGNAIPINYENSSLNQSNQFLLGEQGGLTSANAANPAGNTGMGMTAGNWAGLGLGAVTAGMGFLNKKKELGIAQGNLDLSKNKFQFLKDNRAETQAATLANLAKDKQMQAGA